MIPNRIRQAVAFTALVLCSTCNQAAQLRATKKQHDELITRQLGDVIFIDPDHDYELEQTYPDYGSAQIPIEPYDESLPMVRSGPYAGQDVIDVETNSSSSARNIIMTDRVVGGKSSDPRSYYAMLLYKDNAGWKFAGCGATLITNCHVVTAAHCVEDRQFDIDGIYNNAHTPYSGNSDYPFHFTNAQRIFVPQEYDDLTNVNDIAIIRMTECVSLSEYQPAIPASYGSHSVQSGDMLELYGFGRLGENVGQSGDTKQLQVAELPYISNTQCKNYFGNKIKAGMFCAGYAQGGIDACQGDSGSGLILPPKNPKNPAILMGVVSWGVGCARQGYPGVYANVEDFFEWIKTNTCDDPELDPSISWCHSTTNFNEQANVMMLREGEDCSQNAPCTTCEGQCQNDQDCENDLVCFKRSNDDPFELIPGCLGTGVSGKSYCYNPDIGRFATGSSRNEDDSQLDKETDSLGRETNLDISDNETDNNNDNENVNDIAKTSKNLMRGKREAAMRRKRQKRNRNEPDSEEVDNQTKRQRNQRTQRNQRNNGRRRRNGNQ